MNESCIADSIRDGRKRFSKICIMFVVAAVISYLVVMMLFRLVSKSGMHSRYCLGGNVGKCAFTCVYGAYFQLADRKACPGR